MKTRLQQRGLSLTELLVALTINGLVFAGVVGFFLSYQRASQTEDLTVEMGANLRVGLWQLIQRFRRAGYGAPESDWSSWVPTSWVAGFNTNPLVVAGATAATPDTISLAACTETPVATLAADAAVGATSLTLNANSALDTAYRRLIGIGLRENAVVTAVVGSATLYIDVNPAATGAQGLSNAYPEGTPICRLGIETFSVDTANDRLLLDRHDGTGAQVLLNNVTNLKVIQPSGLAKTYQITLTVRSRRPLPGASTFLSRGMTSAVTLRN